MNVMKYTKPKKRKVLIMVLHGIDVKCLVNENENGCVFFGCISITKLIGLTILYKTASFEGDTFVSPTTYCISIIRTV